MSRNVSLLELKTWTRELSDTENDPFITDSELTALANRHLTEVYDRLVDAGPPDYYAATTSFATESGTAEYELEVDFRSLVGVFVAETDDERRPLLPMTNAGRGQHKAPTGEWTVYVEYIPAAPFLEEDGDTFDGVSGFEELVANLMAKDVMTKRESDPSIVMANIARLESRIVRRARSRDKGAPRRITDLDEYDFSPYPWGWTGSSRLACYRLRGDNLELFEALTVQP